MAIKETTGYETSDGLFFRNEDDANKHEKGLEFDEWYEKDYILDNEGNYVSSEIVKGWLIANKRVIFDLLLAYCPKK